ncbi:pickpocket protein 11-like [Zerene cesonia]|uniref:pickpocket protein 11-like n=1 Tax=Zerene cesonia TaxID=33412 RepID=UPI0018E599D3|nr:pickpocket protein 11-like [Zerene cesonia]
MAQKAHIKVKPAGKKLTIKENVNSKFVDFCKRTDLHGFKYIVMEDLSRMERICWALAVCISIGFAIYFVITAYKWYDRNPIVTVIESTQGPIWEVPFPAVTICSLNFISLAAAKKWSDNLSLPVNKTRAYVFETIKLAPLLFMPSTASNEQIDKLQALQDILDYNSISVKSFFTEVFIENAYNHPDLDSSLRVINPAEEVMIAISPESTYSTPGIRTFNPSKRKCYYKDEEPGSLTFLQ